MLYYDIFNKCNWENEFYHNLMDFLEIVSSAEDVVFICCIENRSQGPHVQSSVYRDKQE